MVEYCCPRCRGVLTSLPDAYRCEPCGARYPVVLGIPDFRLAPDPYISVEDDHEKGRRLQRRAGSTDLEGLLRYYWSITPDTSPELADRYVDHALAGPERGRDLLDGLERAWPADAPPRRALELGCRTGGVLEAMAARCPEVVGIDIAFRWLVVARKRLEDRGLTVQLACCCAEHLPFPDASFDLTVAENVLEHAAAPCPIVGEAYRTLRPAGRLAATTWNRLTPAPEPHVRLWGIGWLPRSWAVRYVKLRRGSDYRHVRLVSALALRGAARASGFRRWRIHLPDFGDEVVARLPPAQRALIRCYGRLKGLRLLRHLFLLVAPVLHLYGQRED